jgi:hypothetical protein
LDHLATVQHDAVMKAGRLMSLLSIAEMNQKKINQHPKRRIFRARFVRRFGLGG